MNSTTDENWIDYETTLAVYDLRQLDRLLNLKHRLDTLDNSVVSIMCSEIVAAIDSFLSRQITESCDLAYLYSESFAVSSMEGLTEADRWVVPNIRALAEEVRRGVLVTRDYLLNPPSLVDPNALHLIWSLYLRMNADQTCPELWFLRLVYSPSEFMMECLGDQLPFNPNSPAGYVTKPRFIDELFEMPNTLREDDQIGGPAYLLIDSNQCSRVLNAMQQDQLSECNVREAETACLTRLLTTAQRNGNALVIGWWH